MGNNNFEKFIDNASIEQIMKLISMLEKLKDHDLTEIIQNLCFLV